MPPKQTKQQQIGKGNPNSPVSASNDPSEDANFANNMQALAKAVSAVQASIGSFREENRASIASLHETLNMYGQRITDIEDGMTEFDKRLDSLETSRTLLTKENDALKEKVAYLDNYTRRQNSHHRWTKLIEVWPQNQQMATINHVRLLSNFIALKLKR